MFIKLTQCATGFMPELIVKVNLNHLAFYANDPDTKGSIIFIQGGKPTIVKESVEEIDKLVMLAME